MPQPDPGARGAASERRLRRLLWPLGVFGVLLALLAVGLTRDPTVVPSPLVGRAAPAFELPALADPERTVSLDDLKGRVTLLNVWATWCVSCRAEHPTLVAIAARGGVPIYGLNWKDDREAALAWLAQLGDPYVASAFDADGRVAIDFGVYGAPETYVLDAGGRIVHKHIGPISPQVWERTLAPIVRRLKAGEQ